MHKISPWRVREITVDGETRYAVYRIEVMGDASPNEKEAQDFADYLNHSERKAKGGRRRK